MCDLKYYAYHSKINDARARREKESRQPLFAVSVCENGLWVELPEKHHDKALAISVARAESIARQQKTRIPGVVKFHPMQRS
jgi:hypothetical protein